MLAACEGAPESSGANSTSVAATGGSASSSTGGGGMMAGGGGASGGGGAAGGGVPSGGAGGIPSVSWSRRAGAGSLRRIEFVGDDPVFVTIADALSFGGATTPVTAAVATAKLSADDGLGIWAHPTAQVATPNSFDRIGTRTSVVDAAGAVYIGGSYQGTVALGSETLVAGTGIGEANAFIAKVDGTTGAVIWAKPFSFFGGGSVLYNESDSNVGLAIDSSGRLVATFVSFFENWRVPRVLRLDPATGDTLDQVWPGSVTVLHTSTLAAAADATGSMAIVGECNNCFGTLVNCPWTPPTGAYRYIAVLDATLQCTGAAEVPFVPDAVVSDGSGGWVVAGRFRDPFIVGGQSFASAGEQDIAVTRFDAGLVHQWTRTLGGTANEFFTDLQRSPVGSFLVTGRFAATADLGGGPVMSAGDYDVFATWFSATGTHLATRAFGSIGNDFGLVRAHGPDIFVGVSTRDSIDFGLGPLAPLSSDGEIAYARLPSP